MSKIQQKSNDFTSQQLVQEIFLLLMVESDPSWASFCWTLIVTSVAAAPSSSKTFTLFFKRSFSSCNSLNISKCRLLALSSGLNRRCRILPILSLGVSSCNYKIIKNKIWIKIHVHLIFINISLTINYLYNVEFIFV